MKFIVGLSPIVLLAWLLLPLRLLAATPETWTVSCMLGGIPKAWTSTTPPNITNGAFQFTLPTGQEVRTTAGMNCYATRNPVPQS